ncbi:MAG TPA: hypothetical protein VFB30_06525 [Spirochaetia bacterium]|nr:hypothetical protein [Spirochaetia bacterium]
MVKTKATLLLVSIAFLACCTERQQGFLLHPETMSIPGNSHGRFVSLAVAGTSLVAAFSERETTTLKFLRLPLGPHLPAEAPAATIVDKIDVAPPLSPTFGAHVLSTHGDIVDILYQDRESEDRSILKLASKSLDAPQWNLDVLEPPGDPLAVLPAANGALSVFWAADAILSRRLPGSSPLSTLRSSFQKAGQASVYGPGGFTVYDAASRSLIVVSGSDTGFISRELAGAAAVHSSLLSSDGQLAVLTWDAQTRRLSLLEERSGAARISRSTITLSERTGTVALLTAPGRSTYMFLFDEERQLGGIRAQHQLSIIAPGYLLGAIGTRYRKAALLSGTEPIEGFAAVETQDALYVLALQGGLKLLRLGLAR